MERLLENGLPRSADYTDTRTLTASTSSTYEYTLKEVVDEILHHARKFRRANFFTRGTHLKRLGYWTDRLIEITPHTEEN